MWTDFSILRHREEFSNALRQPSGCAQLRTTFLPLCKVIRERDSAAPRPAIQRAQIFEHGRISLHEIEHLGDCPARGIEAPVHAQRLLVSSEPGAEARSRTLLACRGSIAHFHRFRVIADGAGEASIVGKGRRDRPMIGQERQAAQGESFHERFLDPLARSAGLRIGLPAITKHVTQLMTELVGEFAPVPRADNQVDPSGRRRGRLQPDRGTAVGAVVYVKPVWLAIGDQCYTVEASNAHVFYHGGYVALRRSGPVASDLQRRSEQSRPRSTADVAGACSFGADRSNLVVSSSSPLFLHHRSLQHTYTVGLSDDASGVIAASRPGRSIR
jgi:hypothetical protein